MSLNLGSTPIGSLYLGSAKVGAAYLGNVKVWGAGLPAKTMRFDFKYDHFDPTTLTDFGGIGATWTHVRDDIYDFYYNNTNWGSRTWSHTGGIGGLFNTYAYRSGTSYVYPMTLHEYDVIDLNLGGVTDVSQLLGSAYKAKNLFSIRNTGSVTNFNRFLAHGSRQMIYTSIPLFDTSSATNVSQMCVNARDVTTGALALYTQMSTQANPPSTHVSCFTNCGSATVSGAAELTQIPTSWGGTGEIIAGKVYPTVTMPDGSTWMAQNLDFAWSGLDVRTAVGTPSTNEYATYYNFDESTYGWNGMKYGLLYTWYAVNYLESNKSTLIPGWHVPSQTELTSMLNSIGGTAGTAVKLKSTTGWSTTNGDGTYKFNLVPAGTNPTSDLNSFTQLGTYGYLWTATSYNGTKSYRMYCSDNEANITNSTVNKLYPYSIRLVKDST